MNTAAPEMQTADQVVRLPLDLLVAFNAQPRIVINPPADDLLLASVKANGVVQPIIVRKINDGLQYEVIDGHRRWSAALHAKLADIPAIIKELTDNQALAIALIQGTQGEPLHPLDEAQGYSNLMYLESLRAPGLAKRLGAERDYVAKRLQLLRLDETGRDIFRGGGMELSHALEVSRLNGADQTDAVTYIVKKQPTIRELRDWLKNRGLVDGKGSDDGDSEGESEDGEGNAKKPERAPNIVTAKAVKSFALALAKLKPKDIAGDKVMLNAIEHLAQRSAEKLLLATRVKEKQPKEKKPKAAKPKAAPRKK